MLYIKKWINKYFAFSKREYNALLFLVFILFVVSVFPYFLDGMIDFTVSQSISEKSAIEKLNLVNKQYKQNRFEIQNQVEDSEMASSTVRFQFDPNTISVNEWQKLGLSPKQAQAIVNYVSKGGKFYKVEDLKKMYTISPKKYKELAPFVRISIPASTGSQKLYFDKREYPKKEIVLIELNSADTIALDKIRGVGTAFAKRIVNYREKIGGFYKKEQLLEVYGVDSLKYNEIKDQITVNSSAIKKININTFEFNDLKNNPYLKFKQINAIIQYRKQHGKYNNIDDLKKVLILTPQNILNLTPYLSF